MTASDHPTATPFGESTDPRAEREPMPQDAGSPDPHGGPMAEGRPVPPPMTGMPQDRTADGPQVGMSQEHMAGSPQPMPGRQGGTATDGPQPGGDDLFQGADLSGLRSRWDDVQAAFVDDPRESVQKADALVSEVVDQLTRQFSEARSRLEGQWSRGEQASTEDLRLALQRYREFFQRLLSM